MIHGNILSENQIEVLGKLNNLPAGTYLAGGEKNHHPRSRKIPASASDLINP